MIKVTIEMENTLPSGRASVRVRCSDLDKPPCFALQKAAWKRARKLLTAVLKQSAMLEGPGPGRVHEAP